MWTEFTGYVLRVSLKLLNVLMELYDITNLYKAPEMKYMCDKRCQKERSF
jgi:hypothetical protein